MVASVLIQRAVWPFIQPTPFLFLTLGVLVGGLHGEWAAGLLATALGTLAVKFWFLPGSDAGALSGRDVLTLCFFAFAGTLVTWINVQRRRGLRAATESEAWLRTTMRSIGDAVIATDRDGRVRFLNAVAERLTGWRTAAAAGRSLHEVFRLVDGQGRLISRDGSEYLIEDSRAPIRDHDGNLTGVVLVFRDASERTREALRRALVAEATEVLIGSLQYESTLATVARLLVPRAADRVSIHMVTEAGPLALLVAAGEETAATGVAPELERVQLERVAKTQRAELRPRKMEVPLTARGRTLGVMLFARNSATAPFGGRDREMAEELARRAADAIDNARLYREAHQAIRVRDDFLAIASHELRTPLTTLQLQLDSLERTADRLPPDIAVPLRRKLDSSCRQALRLASLIDSLLDVSRITTGRLALKPEPMDLVEVAGEIAERFRPQASTAGCEIRLATGQPRIEVLWDRLRIEQVLGNLLANAIKYGAGSPVDIRVDRAGGGARIVIRDHGIGIGKDDVERIFGRFERAVSARNYGGLGLGLFVARQIVEAHGGEIRVGAGPGPGAELVVVMPPEVDAAPRRAAG